MPESVRVKRQNGCFGPLKEIDWDINPQVLQAVKEKRPAWTDETQIASMIADAIPTKELKRKISEMENLPPKYKKPIAVNTSFKLSLPERQQLRCHVELRLRNGVVEVHPRSTLQALDLKAGHT